MNKIFIALLAGVAIGILIAPGKGSATRQKIMEGFDGLATDLSAEARAWKQELQRDTDEPDNITQPIV